MQAKHYRKRRRKFFRKSDIVILTIAILVTANFSYSIIANAAFPREETQEESSYSEEQIMPTESSDSNTDVTPQDLELYEDIANDEQVLAIIEEAQKAGEELVGTAAMIETQKQVESRESNLEKTNSLQTTNNGDWEALVKSLGNQQLWEDYVLLCRTTHAEAGNQTMVQQIGVAATILNRVGTDGFADTIYGVIFQNGQFSTAKNGQVIDWSGQVVTFENDVSETTKEAVYRALVLGEDPTEEWLLEECNSLKLDAEKYAEGGALYFYADYLGGAEAAARSNIKCESQNGTHIFYKVWG